MRAMRVNGTEHVVEVADDTPLIYVLRNYLNLKGTRFGCGQGLCGACLVLIDGHADYSCNVPTWAAAGRSITTVEEIGSDASNPVAGAFVRAQAAQCGYCISGMMVAATALLRHNANPSEDEVRSALDRNLCRCGAHNRIVRAVLSAAADLRSSGAQ